ncbi:double-strand break repair helicase AddA [Acidisoma sp. C75]
MPKDESQPGLPLPAPPSAADARARASRAQRIAADPALSTFVAASAGSGKTKLLTDRLLRLMLAGVDPGRILCLTYTRNGAAEMALRLQDRLGRWVSLPDGALDAALEELGVTPSAAHRARARALFAIVLDLPGGMRIETIHAFCQSLLRRFPLEAGLSPHFRLEEDRDAALGLREAVERVLARVEDGTPLHQAVELLASEVSAATLDQMLARADQAREKSEALLARPPEWLEARLRQLLGATRDAAVLWQEATAGMDAPRLRDALGLCMREGSKTVAERAVSLLDWLAAPEETRPARWPAWTAGFFTKEEEPRARAKLVNAKLDAAHPDLWPVLEAEQQRIAALNEGFAAARLAALAIAFLRICLPVLHQQAGRRQAEGLMDYGSLILRSNDLLRDPGAAWVLFKLDHGLDHLLLDEVQDTAPSQWTIAGSLTAEFFAGLGARDAAGTSTRTVFAVGDRKQSIFGFQGADLRSFDDWRARLRAQVQAAGLGWHDGALDVSFRSATPVLQLVDAVFADPEAARGVVEPGGLPLAHLSARPEDAGAVELWPLIPREETPEPEAWTIPQANLGQVSAPARLARQLALWIARLTDDTTLLESQGRPVSAGDILILLQRRAPLAPMLVRELKAAGVAVAGLDRLALTEQPAVQDLMALADSLLLPEDDLSFACWLTSPLGNLSDASLMALAAGRAERHLVESLRRRAAERADWSAAWGFFAALQAKVDFTPPYALLSQALGPLGGRARLFARLGPEAAEPVDELLQAALTHAASHPPSLQSFLHWLRQSSAEAKREPEAAGDAVRIMTVHASKGLQAPIVILADAARPPGGDREPLLWLRDGESGIEIPIPLPAKADQCAASETVQAQLRAERQEEHHRLLYVALTRAEDRLILCGWEAGRGGARGGTPSWYELAERGFARLGAEMQPAGEGSTFPPARRLIASPQRRPPPSRTRGRTTEAPAPPAWLGFGLGLSAGGSPRPPAAEPARPRPLAPSRPEGAQFGPVPAALSPRAAGATNLSDGRSAAGGLARGALLHALLQHLPDLPVAERQAAGLAFLTRGGIGAMEQPEAEALLEQCAAVLAHPALAPAFAPGSRAEVPVAGEVGGVIVNGVIDRLAVTEASVTLLDFKTNRRPPAEAARVPPLYLRQMAAYAALLGAIFPGRQIQAALVWTETASVMPLPAPLLAAHAPGAATLSRN